MLQFVLGINAIVVLADQTGTGLQFAAASQNAQVAGRSNQQPPQNRIVQLDGPNDSSDEDEDEDSADNDDRDDNDEEENDNENEYTGEEEVRSICAAHRQRQIFRRG